MEPVEGLAGQGQSDELAGVQQAAHVGSIGGHAAELARRLRQRAPPRGTGPTQRSAGGPGHGQGQHRRFGQAQATVVHQQGRTDLGQVALALDHHPPAQSGQRRDQPEQVAVEAELVDDEATRQAPVDERGQVVALEIGIEGVDLVGVEGGTRPAHAASASG